MILIFTEAFTHTGLGHLGRCTALAEILTERGHTTKLIVNSDSAFPDWEFPCEVIHFSWLDLSSLEKFVFKLDDDTVSYIDSYLAPIGIYNSIGKLSKELICIDDTNRLQYPEGCTILNPGYPGLFIDYDHSKYKVITGKEQALLRKPFREKFIKPIRNKPPRKLLVTLGGTDPHFCSEVFLEILVKNFPDLEKNVIIGAGFTNEDKLHKIADNSTILYKSLTALEMRDLMLSVVSPS